MFSQWASENFSSSMFLTGAAQNLVCLSIARQLGVDIPNPWITWLTAACVPALVGTLAAPFVAYRLYPPEVKEARTGNSSLERAAPTPTAAAPLSFPAADANGTHSSPGGPVRHGTSKRAGEEDAWCAGPVLWSLDLWQPDRGVRGDRWAGRNVRDAADRDAYMGRLPQEQGGLGHAPVGHVSSEPTSASSILALCIEIGDLYVTCSSGPEAVLCRFVGYAPPQLRK